MKGKGILIFLGSVVLGFIVIRFVLSLFEDPANTPSSKATVAFPICQGSSESIAVLKIQKHLNTYKKSFITPYLKEDGIFGSKTQWELNDQNQAICVSKDLYATMNIT